MKSKLFAALAPIILLLACAERASAQWQTQTLTIKPGWTAVYLFVDASYTNLDYLVGSDPGNPITEIWMWQPNVSSVQFVTSAQNPITGSSQWANWERLGTGQPSTLAALAPNAAYLIHSTATTNYTWKVKGNPVSPNYYWTTTGINFIGFPTVTNAPPLLDTFLAPVPALSTIATIFQYGGGNLSANNPAQVFAPHAVTVNRGQAFWITTPSYANTYFGPFQVVSLGNGAAFGASASSTSLRLINTTHAPVTIKLTLQPSEAPPAGLPAIAGVPPVIVRGTLNPDNLTYAALSLTATNALSWTLAPQGQGGSDIAVILGVNRAVLTNNPAGFFAGILRFTDTSNLTEVDLPTSAQAGSYAGLWVGNARLSQVSNYLKNYQRDPDGNLSQNTNGSYMVTSVNTNLGPVASSATYPMRLILHNDGTNVNLLQRVFYGAGVFSNTVVATGESALDPSQLSNARRITAVQFPWTPTNQTWLFSGKLLPGGLLKTSTSVKYDDYANNPFLHVFHPDHDNLDTTFQKQLPIGSESYQIDRSITMNITAPANDYNSLTQFGQSFSGAYLETITMTGLAFATRTFNVAGAFTINRISSIGTLTQGH